MSNLRENLELIEVVYQNDNKKAILTYLDEDKGEVLEVNFNKQSYENGKFVDDPEKAEKVDEWCETYFETTFDKLTDSIGKRMNVYVYENFNSLWESKNTEKFDVKDKGKIFNTKITNVTDDGVAIRINFEVENKEYESKMTYAKYVEGLRKWFPNPQKQQKKYHEFEDKFGVSVENKDDIVGKDIMVEVKVAFGKFAYSEIKKPNWA